MNKFADHKAFLTGIGLAILVFIIAFYFSYRQTRYANDTASWVAHTQEVLFHSEKLFLSAANIETGTGAFLLTGQHPFLEILELSGKNAASECVILKGLTSDNAYQQLKIDSLAPLIAKRIEFSDSIVRLKRKTAATNALEILSAASSRLYTDQLTRLVKAMQQEEYRLLSVRKKNNLNAIAIQQTLFICADFFMLGLLILVFVKERKYILKKERGKSAIMFRDLLEQAIDAMVIVNETGRIVFFNQQAEKLFQYNKQELYGMAVESLIPGDIDIRHKHSSEYTGIKKNALEFPMEVNISPFQTENGLLICASIQDITGRRQAEEMLKKSEELFRLLVSGVKDYAIFMVDVNGLVATWNSGAESIKGYTEAEIIGQPTDIFYTEEDIQKGIPQKNLQEALKQGQHETEGWRVRKDGSKFYANIIFTPLTNDRGLHYGYTKVTRDITEKRKSNASMLFLASIAGNMKDPIITSGNNAVITGWNREAENLLEWKSEEVIGKNTMETLSIIYPNQSREEVLAAFAEKDYWRGEVIYHAKSGRPVNVLVTASKLKDAEGIITGNLIVVRDISNRIKAEEKLKEFEHFFNNSNDLSCIANKEGYFEILNPSFQSILGYTQTELSGRSFVEFVHPDDIAATLHVFGKLNAGAQVIQCFNRYRKKDGGYLLFDWNVSLNLVTGKLYCIARDITERKKAEDALSRLNEELEQKVLERTETIKKSEKKYRYLFENNPLPMWVIDDTSFKFLDVNNRAILHYGYSRDEFLAMTALDIRPDEDKQAFLAARHLSQNNPASSIRRIYNHLKKDGSIIQVEISAHQVIFETINAQLILAHDVTEQKKAEKKLIASEQRFRSIIEQYPSPVVMYAPDGTYITANPAWELMWQDKRENVAGYNIRKDPQMISSGLSKSIEKAFTGETASSDVYLYDPSLIGKTGRKRWIQMHIYPLKDTAGTILEVILIMLDMTDNKLAEEKLAASEMHFRALIEHSAEGISLSDALSNSIYRSPAAQKIMGAITTNNTISLTHPDDIPALQKKYDEVLENPGKPIPFQGRFMHAAANYVWLEGTLTNLLDVKEVNAIVTNFRDITERKKLEMLLFRSNSLARIGGWEIDLIRSTVYWTDITKEIHETLPDYIPDLDTGINFYKEGKSRDLIRQKLNEAIASGKSWDVELQIITAKHNERWIRVIGETEFINGKCIKVYGSFQDIDERKIAAEKLVKSEGLYRSLFTNMLDGFCYCQAIFTGDQLVDYTCLAVNSEFEKLTGLKNITGKKMSEVIPQQLNADPKYSRMVRNVALHGQSQKFETYNEPTSQWLAVSLYSPGKGYFVSLIDNITDRKMAEQKIKEINIDLEERVIKRTSQLKKTNEEMEAFSYSVSHDLRAPLRAIIGFSSILEEEFGEKLGKEAKRLTSTIKRNALKMGQLIDDLLNFSRLGRQQISKAAFDTYELVKEVIADLNGTSGDISVEWIIHQLPGSFADRNTLKQVWLNLISNAVKYSGKAEHPRIEIGYYEAEGQTVFFIKDNGAGFDEKYKHKLFKVFQRLHTSDQFEGTGVGLAIVEKIISKHEGAVWAEAAENMGATFYFSLPVYAGKA